TSSPYFVISLFAIVSIFAVLANYSLPEYSGRQICSYYPYFPLSWIHREYRCRHCFAHSLSSISLHYEEFPYTPPSLILLRYNFSANKRESGRQAVNQDKEWDFIWTGKVVVQNLLFE